MNIGCKPPVERKCITCGTTSAKHYKGVMTSRTQCVNCYQKQKTRERKSALKYPQALDTTRVFDMWGVF